MYSRGPDKGNKILNTGWETADEIIEIPRLAGFVLIVMGSRRISSLIGCIGSTIR